MAQQLQQPPAQQVTQPQVTQPQFQQRYGTQMGAGAIGQAIGQRYEESVPSDLRHAVEDLDKVSTVAEWAKTRAAARGLPRVARVCNDIEDLAHLQKKLVIRQSPFAVPIGQTTLQVIQQGLSELQQHMSEPEVQETINSAQRSLDSIQRSLSVLQSMGTQQVGTQQAPGFGGPQGPGTGGFGGQQMGGFGGAHGAQTGFQGYGAGTTSTQVGQQYAPQRY